MRLPISPPGHAEVKRLYFNSLHSLSGFAHICEDLPLQCRCLVLASVSSASFCSEHSAIRSTVDPLNSGGYGNLDSVTKVTVGKKAGYGPAFSAMADGVGRGAVREVIEYPNIVGNVSPAWLPKPR